MAYRWLGCLPLLAAFAGAPCASAADQTPIKIGFHGALTGPFSVDGLNGQTAINMAIDTWNKAGGIKGHPIQLITYDDQAKPDQAVPIANKLVGDDKVVAVISATLSEPTKAAAPFVQDAGIPYVSTFASSPDITSIGDYVFRIGILGELEGRAAAKTISDVVKKKRVVMLTVKSDLGHQVSKGFHSVAKQFDLEIVKEIEFSISDRQFGPVIADIKALNPDVVFMTGYYFNGTFLPQLRSAGSDATFVGMSSFSAKQFIDIGGTAAEGALVVNVIDWSNPSPTTKDFLDDFEKKTGFPPTASAAHAYAGAQVLFRAIQNSTDMSPSEIRNNLASTKFDTVVGPLSFNSRHEAKRVAYISEIKNGSYTTRETIDDSVLLAPPEK
jgi:branched-chain amino acid transport system substrate-binding protein